MTGVSGVELVTSAQRVARRAAAGRELALLHGGVVRRADLMAWGLSRYDIDTELRRGVWQAAGTHTICVDGREPRGEGVLWRALWESGPRSVLDGATSLAVAGLQGWTETLLHVSVPRNATIRPVPGVRHHVLRVVGPATETGLRRTRPEVATVRAAQWARTDREAATLVAMTVQQRLVSPRLLLERWATVRRSRRRTFLDAVIRDVCDGAHSINELDVASACRSRGLPEPSRQVVRTASRGRVYLDLLWDDEQVHVEVQGAHHYQGVRVVDDALRANDVAIADPCTITLHVPVLGWRICPDRYLDQIAAALAEGRRRRAA